MNDLNKPVNDYLKFFDKYNRDTLLIILSSIACIVSVLSLLIANIALSDAKTANIRSQMQTENIQELKGDINVYRIRAAKMDAWLKAHNVPTEEIYDD